MPAHKKDPSVRARSNRAATSASLAANSRVVAPQLPEDRDWHPMTRQWWSEVWSSPMASEYLAVDSRGLFVLAVLEDDFWTAETAKERKDAAAEIRLQRKDYGLTPYDRRRLEWVVENVGEAQDRGRARRERSGAQQPSAGADPRSVLRAVN